MKRGAGGGWTRALSLLTLRRSRQLLRNPLARLLAGTVAVVYLFLALLVGKMLELAPTAERSTTVLLLTSGGSWWNFPALVVVAPNATLVLPYFSTIAMIVVTAGVSLGMTVAVLLGVRLARDRSRTAGRSAAVSSTAGLTPVLIALVTLGACCSTTAAATAGIGLAAQSTGTTVSAVLAANWYLGVFQIVVLFVALLAQEQLVEIYAMFRKDDHPTEDAAPMVPPRANARTVAGGVLRLGLVLGGVSWALGVVAAWTTTNPWTASGATWADWILLHGVVGSFAISAGLFPRETRDVLAGTRRTVLGVRALLAGSGILLLSYLPTAVAHAGLYGLGNVLLGALGTPASAGGVAPPLPAGVALMLVLGVQYGLLGLMAIAAALAPEALLAPLVAAGPQPSEPEAVDPRPSHRRETPESGASSIGSTD